MLRPAAHNQYATMGHFLLIALSMAAQKKRAMIMIGNVLPAILPPKNSYNNFTECNKTIPQCKRKSPANYGP